ncbi:MAG: class I SAM-dependent methyltransferase [Ignavibacteriaceae bacterium]|nr:class I SAM-dependent methyltransferase [Ignavibacteriaceae bacterium]
MGWFNSFKSGKPVDKDNNPIPWFTYPANEFLSERLNKKMNVFEFGSGNSTLFFAARVNQITSVEHNKEWYEKILKNVIANSRTIFVKADNPNEYLSALTQVDQKYDIIIVDGIYRNECLIESINYLTDGGIIILDDSERPEYSMGVNRILANQFKRIDFWGISPGYLYRKSTSIFYKKINCLSI